MKQLFVFLICVIAFSHCNKKDDANGNEVLEGRLTYSDPYSGDGLPKGLGGRSLKLSKTPSDTLNFLYSVKTDAEGYFVFNRIHKDSTYALFFDDTIQGTKYFAFGTYKGRNENIWMEAVPNVNDQSVLYIQTKDNNGQPMKSTVCLFNSKTLFDADSCNGSIEQLTTDNFGRYVRYGLLSGTYYLRAQAQAGNVSYTGTTTAVVMGKGLISGNISLSPNNFYSNGIKFTVLDNFKSPVPGTTLCLFNNRTLFSADTCLGSILSVTTDPNGEKQVINIIPGKYFVLARTQYGNIVLKGKDSVVVNTTGISKDTVYVK